MSQDTLGSSRREFLGTVAAAGAFAMAGAALGQTAPAAGGGAGSALGSLNVAIIGVGSQGRNLLMNCLKIPGIRFVAVCDVWPYAQEYAGNVLKKYDQTPTLYADYQDMLAREKSLDAVIVATPDWVHAEQTVACLKAGKHVYCEKEMSNTLEGARSMVLAARQTGKLLQIGHQRRSNPRYQHGLKMIEKDQVLGRITTAYGQWNRARRLDLGWPKGREMTVEALKRYGYESMEQFRNWRWWKKYAGGPICDLGSHQIDVFNWFLKTRPAAVMASGGADYYKDREWYDNVMAIYEYHTPAGVVRAFYQVLNTTSYGEYYETFMGDEGTMVISEDARKGLIFREVQAKRREWEDESKKVESMDREAIQLKLGETLAPDGKKDPKGQALLAESLKPVHQVHLENFFSAIRNGTSLTCPPEVGYETAVTVMLVNEAMAAGKRLEFKPEMFKV